MFCLFVVISQLGEKQTRVFINPLTPDLNPSAQRCLTRFLLGILLLEQ
jgi:hypothetical protein